MLLAIDVGNTNMVFGLYEGERLRGTFRISTNAERTSDELGMQISQYYHFMALTATRRGRLSSRRLCRR